MVGPNGFGFGAKRWLRLGAVALLIGCMLGSMVSAGERVRIAANQQGVVVQQHEGGLFGPTVTTSVQASSDGTVQFCQKCGRSHPVAKAVSAVTGFVSESLAQRKANQQASEGRMRHVGGGFGGGGYEGVGFSTSSPDAAIRACCYYGQKKLIDSGVAYGYSKQYRAYGWFATNIYQ